MMKKEKRSLWKGMAIAAAAVIAAFLPACECGTEDFIPVESISGCPRVAYIGEELPLTGWVEPEEATNHTILWRLHDGLGFAELIDGNILVPKAEGLVYIVAVVNPGKTRTTSFTQDIFISVKKRTSTSVTGVKLDKTTLVLAAGTSAYLTATVLPSGASDKNVLWSSSNAKTAQVDQTGKVTARAAGQAIITVTTEDGGKSASCLVEVTK